MPLIDSPYRPPLYFRWSHAQTVYPTLFRRVAQPPYRRETIETADGDFLDLDFWCQSMPSKGALSSRPLAVIAHGMEGSSDAVYVRGMAVALYAAGWDILAWNMRGCGGQPNKKKFFYHSGKTDDLEAVIAHGQKTHAVFDLLGFSLGGNVLLKYLGEIGGRIPAGLRGAVAVSVPCDLEACAENLRRPVNFIYLKRFLLSFRGKVRAKMKTLPSEISDDAFSHIRDIHDFDNRYTAPDFGYPDAHAYWQANACLAFLPAIVVPTLLLTSLDDPFLSATCYPREIARANPNFCLEISKHGGHCSFIAAHSDGLYYSEARAREFLKSVRTGTAIT